MKKYCIVLLFILPPVCINASQASSSGEWTFPRSNPIDFSKYREVPGEQGVDQNKNIAVTTAIIKVGSSKTGSKYRMRGLWRLRK